jgi:hypothetical protein
LTKQIWLALVMVGWCSSVFRLIGILLSISPNCFKDPPPSILYSLCWICLYGENSFLWLISVLSTGSCHNDDYVRHCGLSSSFHSATY